MRADKLISVNEIKFRNQAVNSEEDPSKDAGNFYMIATESVDGKKSTLKNDVYRFFQECTNKFNAERYQTECMIIMKDLKEDASLLSILENKFSHEIIPYISNLDDLKSHASRLNLAESTISSINNAVKINKVCDRIITNDYKLSKRFNFNKYIKENTYKPFDHVIIECCKMIDTYNTPSYAKMNIIIEELSYVYQNNGINYDPNKMIQLISEYFLNTTDGDLKDLQTVLDENLCISGSDINNSILLTEEVEENNGEQINPYDINNSIDNINKCVIIFNNFKAKQGKAVDNFKETINAISDEPLNYQIDALPQIFDWIRNFGIDIYINNLEEFISIFEKYIEFLANKAREDQNVNKLLLLINSEMLNVHKIEDYDQKYSKYYAILSNTIDDINSFNQIRITDSEAMMEGKLLNIAKDLGNKILNKGKDLGDKALSAGKKAAMSLKDYKVFKFENLLNYTYKINKKLKAKEGKFMGKVKGKLKDIFSSAKSWLNEDYDMSLIESESIIDCITEKQNFDHVLAIYEATDYKYINDIRAALDEFCRENSEDTFVTYYTENDLFFEVHVADTTYIELTESEYQEWLTTFTEAEQAYCGYMINTLETINKLNDIDAVKLAEDFSKVEYCLTSDAVLGIIEASKYLYDMIPYARLEEIANTYADNHPTDYIGNTSISQALSSWKLEESNIETATEIVYLLREAIDGTMLNEAGVNTKVDTSIKGNNKNTNSKDKDNSSKSTIKDKLSNAKDTVKDGAEKLEKTKLNLNSLRYAMEDLKLKSKNAGDKATAFTNTINIYVQKFIESMRKLYTNNDREQIIRGSIIPSFHQLIGRLLVIGAATTGVGFFYGSSMALFTAVVTSFATIAASKHSTDKERALMLDELAIDMDVCEKEMQRAEANGNLKKYRALSYRMVKLKREYQRIRYNVGYKQYKHTPAVGTDQPVAYKRD